VRRGTVGAHARTPYAALILRNPVQGRCTRVASTIAMMPDISPIVACLIAVVSDSIALRHGDDFGFSAESLGGFD